MTERTMTAVLPCRLVLIQNKCFYCDATDPVYTTLVQWLFGIIHCRKHDAFAMRDVKAYMHSERKVAMGHAREHPDIRPLLELLDAQPFTIRRSNGELQADWMLEYKLTHLKKLDEFGWVIPLQYSKDKDLVKNVQLSMFMEPDILATFPPTFADCLANAVRALDAGVYAKEAAEAVNPTAVDTSAEGMMELVLCDGHVVRAIDTKKLTGLLAPNP